MARLDRAARALGFPCGARRGPGRGRRQPARAGGVRRRRSGCRQDGAPTPVRAPSAARRACSGATATRSSRPGRSARSSTWPRRRAASSRSSWRAARGPHEVVAALARELQAPAPTVLVLEDLHWADEATLDVMRLLARRVETIPALILATYRDDELDARASAAARARRACDAAGGRADQARAAVAGGGRAARRAARRRRRRALPQDRRQPVLRHRGAGRRRRRDPRHGAGRRLRPRRAPEPRRRGGCSRRSRSCRRRPSSGCWRRWRGDAADGLEECLASGMLDAAAGGRRVPPRARPARGRGVDRTRPAGRAAPAALAALADPPAARRDLARLAHHAEAAGDADAVLRFAPRRRARGRRSARTARRPPSTRGRCGSATAAGRPSARSCSKAARRECYLTDEFDEAIAARQQALEHGATLGDRLREGDSLRQLARLLGSAGRSAEERRGGRRGVDAAGAARAGPRARARYGTLAQRCELGGRGGRDRMGPAGAGAGASGSTIGRSWSTRSRRSARPVPRRLPAGTRGIERSIELARGGGFEDQSRVGSQPGLVLRPTASVSEAREHTGRGLAYCGERGLDYWWLSLLACRARCQLAAGRWSEAADTALFVLGPRAPSGGRACSRSPSRGSSAPAGESRSEDRARRGGRARRGHRRGPADRAGCGGQSRGGVAGRAASRRRCDHPGRTGAGAAVRCPVGDRRARCYGDAVPASMTRSRRRRRGRTRCRSPAVRARRPTCGASSGAHTTRRWRWPTPTTRSCCVVRTPSCKRWAPLPAAAIVARRLRERGATGLRADPRTRTRENPAGLTARELEVLDLWCRASPTPRSPAASSSRRRRSHHHVSAILRKLDVRTRAQAGAEAVRRGFAAPSWADASSNPGRSPDAPGA